MIFRSMRWRFALPLALLILAANTSLALVLANDTRGRTVVNLEEALSIQARLLADDLVTPLSSEWTNPGLTQQARQWATLLSARVTIVDANGVVLGDSDADYAQMDNHLRRPEIQEASNQGLGNDIRVSETLDTEMVYAAAAVVADDQIIGYARVGRPLSVVNAPTLRVLRTALAGGVLMTAIAFLLAVVVAERTARPIRQLTEAAQRMAGGDMDARLFAPRRDEVGALATSFNEMGRELQGQLSRLTTEGARMGTVLELMADGVLITDAANRVQLLNPAAAELLDTSPDDALGRTFAQVARHHRFIEVLQRCRDEDEEQVETVEIGRRGLFVSVTTTPLPEQQGALIILRNLTPLRHLQMVRRDFISNISHELRTPLASLKAVVDTLRDGALDEPETARRFLNHADREVDALTQMVQELLELSRIESGSVPLRLTPTAVADIILPAVERFRPQVERANLQLAVNLPRGLPAVLVDRERIEQVLTNLLYNAIKFTQAGGAIEITARPDNDVVVVRVKDTGVGIAAAALPRIFERFYKVDRARSGGGTGLGLAIARHLVQAHGGRIWAKSKEGKGSTFYFSLPLASPETGLPAG